MNLRPATLDDARLLWEWRNDPAVRANSFDHGEIPYDEHVDWLRRRLYEYRPRGSAIWIAEVDGTPVGQVRYGVVTDEDGSRWAELSYSIAADHRGQGHATEMLRLSAPRACASLPPVDGIRAKVYAHNGASIRALEKAGYRSEIVEMVWQG